MSQKKTKTKKFSFPSTILLLICISILGGFFLLILSIILLVSFLTYPFYKRYFLKKYPVYDIADEVFFAITNDGWNLAIHRHKPHKPLVGAMPIILVHGIITNKYFMDLDTDHSLAYHLKTIGYDVYAVSLRGCGESYTESENENFSFDDIVEKDVPAIINEVCNISGKPKINWVAHSMGAMILYSYLGISQKKQKDKIKSFVSLGGPGNLAHSSPVLGKIALKYISFSKRVDIKLLAKFILPFVSLFNSPLKEFFYNPQVTPKNTVKKMLVGIENIPDGLMTQMLNWVAKGGDIVSLDEKYNYTELQTEITCPILFIAGGYDNVATPSSLKSVYNKVNSKYKEFHTISESEGFSGNYGHACLVMGKNAKREIFPLIEKFLAKYGKAK
ncbi:MAG: alpha/beta hydrolase [Leptospiraceae bacterium]|nr:alpha/beta hydrolase [Leptospiraceae bacterium]MBK9503196.1 alpha/beta hydrolase [Leptospiraceae bacterium]MBP9162477.1 alpha/beta hydrolase [Leptospiraceae bacterium]